MSPASDPVGIMVISAWLEVDATADGLRARLTTIDAVDRHVQSIATAASGVDGICDEVRRWLEAFDAGSVVQPAD